MALAAGMASTPLLAADDSGVLQEVLVTAQKREENLRDVPIAITAFGQQQIEDRGIDTAFDLNSVVPNLQVSHMPSNSVYSQISIRGSVSGNPAIYNDTTVGIYVDGVYMAKSA
ncbi:MAG: TonB-dependent receptor plug domain-containing protein, partial [Proteobacteria bacterium]|nr:TonB-dependent receptor plug domain-containing protein [Pseudomonadota bacterium]